MDLADGTGEVLVHHRQRIRAPGVTDIGGNVVPARNLPAMTDAEILVAIFRLDHARLLARSARPSHPSFEAIQQTDDNDDQHCTKFIASS